MKILRLRNINIKINIFMVVIFILFFLFGYTAEVFIVVLTVLIHELFHSFAAKKFGFSVDEIEIFPFGGIAKFEYLNTVSPIEEIFICVMGPLSNFLIMIIFMGIKSIYNDFYLIDYIIKINKLMLLINILPIFPLDGGKIIRAILSLFIGYKSSTVKLTYITYILCIFMMFYDILYEVTYNSIYTGLIVVFILTAAKKEKEMAAFVFIKSITRKANDINKKKKMKVHLLVCLRNIRVKEALECFLPNKYHIFIVIKSNGETIGTITEGQLIEGILNYGLDITMEELLIESKK